MVGTGNNMTGWVLTPAVEVVAGCGKKHMERYVCVMPQVGFMMSPYHVAKSTWFKQRDASTIAPTNMNDH